MKKKVCFLVMALVLLAGSLAITGLAASGDEFHYDGVKYRVSTEDAGSKTGTAYVPGSGGKDTVGAVIMPETVTNGDFTYTVNYLQSSSFRGSAATQIYLPYTLSSVASGSPNNPIFVEMKNTCVIYFANPALEALLKGGNEGGGCTFDKTASVANTNGGVLHGSLTDEAGVLATNFVKENCTFGGWFNNPHLNGSVCTHRQSKEHDRYYAMWLPNDGYAAVMYSDGFSAATVNEAFAADGSPYVLPENTYSVDGYQFVDWMLSRYDVDAQAWVAVGAFKPGDTFTPEEATLYRATAQWTFGSSVSCSFEDSYDWTFKAENSFDGVQYHSLRASGYALGLSKSSFAWYKYDEAAGEWVNTTKNVSSSASGRWSQSTLYFKSVSDAGRYKCVISVTQNGVTYSVEDETVVRLSPATITVTPKPQTVVKGGSIDTVASATTVTVSGNQSDLKTATIYGKLSLVTNGSIDSSVPGIYENAITLVDGGVEALSENYIFVLNAEGGDLTVKETPTFTWNAENVYSYTYQGKPITPILSATVNGTEALGAPTGSVTYLYNGSETVPTAAGEYTVTAVYEGDANYDKGTAECPEKLVIGKADVSIAVKSQSLSAGNPLPALGIQDLIVTSDTLSKEALSSFKEALAAAISEGRLTFSFLDGDGNPVTTAPAAGTYTIVPVISDEDSASLDENVTPLIIHADTSGGTDVGQLTVKSEMTITASDMEAVFTGEGLPYDTSLIQVDANGYLQQLSLLYYIDYEWVEQAPLEAGTYQVRIYFEGDEDYMPASTTVKMTVLPACVTVVAKDKTIGEGDDLASAVFTVDDVEIVAEGVTDEIKQMIREYLAMMMEYQMAYPCFDGTGAASGIGRHEDGVTFRFIIGDTMYTLDEMRALNYIPITPDIARALNLDYLFEQLIVEFEKGDRIVKKKPTVELVATGDISVQDADSELQAEGIDKIFTTEMTMSPVILTAENLLIHGGDGMPAPTGAVTVLYRHAADDDEFLAPDNYPVSMGHYVVRIIIEEDNNYARTEYTTLVFVTAARLTVAAKPQAVDVNGTVNQTHTAIQLSGRILSNDEMKALLEEALPALFECGALCVSVAPSVNMQQAGLYREGIVVSYYPERMTGDMADAAMLFEILPVAADLTVYSYSEDFSAVKNRIDGLESAQSDLAALLAAKADASELAAAIEELSSKIAEAKEDSDIRDAALEVELRQAIEAADAAISEAVAALVTRVEGLAQDVALLISSKADAAAVAQKFTETEAAIHTLQTLLSEYGDAVADTKAETEALVEAAKAEIVAMILAGDNATSAALRQELSELREELGKKNENAEKDSVGTYGTVTGLAILVVVGDLTLALFILIRRRRL